MGPHLGVQSYVMEGGISSSQSAGQEPRVAAAPATGGHTSYMERAAKESGEGLKESPNEAKQCCKPLKT